MPVCKLPEFKRITGKSVGTETDVKAPSFELSSARQENESSYADAEKRVVAAIFYLLYAEIRVKQH